MMYFRGLELHGRSFLSHEKVERALDLICRYQLTALVIHDTDFLTQFIFPTAFFNPYAPWSGAPARRGENALHNNIAYFQDLLKRAQRKGVDVWLEVKELTFPDEIIEMNPHVLKNGIICPTDPLWADVIRAKYQDVIQFFPEVKGIIVSAGSPEGKTALSQNKCSCEQCASTPLDQWYRSILDPIYETLAPRGVKLAVREFSYTRNHQIAITDAVNSMSEDVIYCIKVTPHDFYPTFPHNTLIERVDGRPKWIEYDTMGQYCGWGVIPCFMMRDIDKRFAYASDHKVEGALLRAEWERLNDYWSLDGLNRMNLLAAAHASRGAETSSKEVLSIWLQEEQISYSNEEFSLLEQYLEDTWEILRKSLYVNDFVLNDSSMVPPSVERAWWSMADKHSLSEWFPERGSDLILDENKLARYIAEKDEALHHILEWRLRAQQINASSWITNFLKQITDITERYVRLHMMYGKLCLLSSFSDQKQGDISNEIKKQLMQSAIDLDEYSQSLRLWLSKSDFTHLMFLLFNPDRCVSLVKGAKKRINSKESRVRKTGDKL